MNKNMVLALLLSCFALHGLAAEDEELMDCNEDELGFPQYGNCLSHNQFVEAKRRLDAEYEKLISVFKVQAGKGPSYRMAKNIIEELRQGRLQRISDECNEELELDMSSPGISGEQNTCMAEKMDQQVPHIITDREYWQQFLKNPEGFGSDPNVVTNNEYGPSFSCQQASSQQEKLICSDDTLRALDSALHHLYQAAKLNSHARDQLQATQREWMTKTRNQCDNSACLIAAYRSRILVLASQ